MFPEKTEKEVDVCVWGGGVDDIKGLRTLKTI